jgi:hypothetical protein
VPTTIFAHISIVFPIKERLLVIKQATQEVDMERLSSTNLSEFEGRKQYQIKM